MTYLPQQLQKLDWNPDFGLQPEDFNDLDAVNSNLLVAVLVAELTLGERDPQSLRLLPKSEHPDFQSTPFGPLELDPILGDGRMRLECPHCHHVLVLGGEPDTQGSRESASSEPLQDIG